MEQIQDAETAIFKVFLIENPFSGAEAGLGGGEFVPRGAAASLSLRSEPNPGCEPNSEVNQIQHVETAIFEAFLTLKF